MYLALDSVPEGNDMLVQVAVAVGIDGDVVVVARLDETDGLSRRIVYRTGATALRPVKQRTVRIGNPLAV